MTYISCVWRLSQLKLVSILPVLDREVPVHLELLMETLSSIVAKSALRDQRYRENKHGY